MLSHLRQRYLHHHRHLRQKQANLYLNPRRYRPRYLDLKVMHFHLLLLLLHHHHPNRHLVRCFGLHLHHHRLWKYLCQKQNCFHLCHL
jgi:hypothetical protein